MTAWLKISAAAGALLIAATPPALAHTSYLLPSKFATTESEIVTLEASFAEDFFRPEFAVVSDDYHLYRPDGTRDSYDTLQAFREVTILESDLDEDGTYRFTTGERLGRKSVTALVDGAWTFVEPGQPAPENAAGSTAPAPWRKR